MAVPDTSASLGYRAGALLTAVGPGDLHWLYMAGVVGLAAHLLRDRARAWTTA